MRFKQTRYLVLFLAAMFFANNVAAAVRACVASHAMHERSAASASAEPACPPQSGEAGTCLKHLAQSFQSDEQSCLADFSPVVIAPAVVVSQASFQVQSKTPALASTSPIVGPPLTILFGNFRN